MSKQSKNTGFSFAKLGLIAAVMMVGGYFILGSSFAGGVQETIEAGDPNKSGKEVLDCNGSGAEGSYVQLGSVDDAVDC